MPHGHDTVQRVDLIHRRDEVTHALRRHICASGVLRGSGCTAKLAKHVRTKVEKLISEWEGGFMVMAGPLSVPET